MLWVVPVAHPLACDFCRFLQLLSVGVSSKACDTPRRGLYRAYRCSDDVNSSLEAVCEGTKAAPARQDLALHYYLSRISFELLRSRSHFVGRGADDTLRDVDTRLLHKLGPQLSIDAIKCYQRLKKEQRHDGCDISERGGRHTWYSCTLRKRF